MENEASAFLRRLIPFPGAEGVSPLLLPPMSSQSGATKSDPVSSAAGTVREQTASIVLQAASVLDEEMARGVLTARRSADSAPYGQSETSNPVLRQVHELVNNIAAAWPTLQNAQGERTTAWQSAATEADPLAEVRPHATVRPGQRATISMMLRNSESRAVRLVPAATDLLGSRSGQIVSSLIEFTPPEFSLEPQEQRDLTIATTVPVDAAPGCYSGLLVVRGLDYLRALITIEVV